MTAKPYQSIVEFCERRLAEYGDSAAGVGWNAEDADIRYRVMLELIRDARPCSMLDFGCGVSHLLEYIRRNSIEGIDYHGLDVSQPFIELSRRKFPGTTYYSIDLLHGDAAALPRFDYVVMNGIFTYKGDMPHARMFDYCRAQIEAVFRHAIVGLAFNAITPQVDWTRDDLFHLPLDPVMEWLARNVSRHIVVRHDYGLYEYTVYVYREPSGPPRQGVKRLVGQG